MPELKPCPFCGGKAEIKNLNVYFRPQCIVMCTKCKARTTEIDQDLSYCAHDKAAELWNTRFEEPVDDK